MPRRMFRFSIRRWVVVVAVVAAALGASVAARDWFRIHARLISARHDYARSLELYDEGRVTCLEVAFRSRCMMDAESELAHSNRARTLAISAHVIRLQFIRDEEARELAGELDCRGVGRTMLGELDEVLIAARTQMINSR